ncbi:hypothetical protein PsorP6_016558 [Peronosclerospora sorghi]|uniref:Uncharacterized protein n=1 Tax=Peronosclerospora sorghi TaxID=230839 RepID=A0ACC0VKF4_9STRA|nr:hypothetical protein PsorP6_016558 [Peronosclerospora sorghi]
MVYGRQGGLYKKKFHLLDLWECKVEDDVEILPGVLTPVTTSNNVFAIKNGWLNVFDGAVVSESDESSTNGSPTTSSTRSKKFRRLWITFTLQTISLGSTFKTTQPKETVPIELCLVASLKNETLFRLQLPSDLVHLLLSPYFLRALFTPFRLLLSS